MQNSNEEIVTILSKLDEDDLFSLAKTVTQDLKKSRNIKEAIENIIKYSPDEISILRRKVVTKETLFHYLEKKKISVRLPITKNELIDKIVDSWNIPQIHLKQENQALINIVGSSGELTRPINKKDDISEMAEQFAKWFYSMLNENEFGAEHFFPDSKLKMNMFSNGDCDSTIVENDPEEIKDVLLRSRLQHNLYFNPNLSKEGVQGRMDWHGLVMVLTCGTLHVQNVCAGVFEQVFALARDPCSDNNWKIKNTELNLRSKSDILGPPRLSESELTSELLMLPSE